jgi:hypothetical protein
LKDFTIKQYQLLLNALIAQGYSFQSFAQYVKEKENSVIGLSTVEAPRSSIILRHDVETNYEQALKFAKIQHSLGIQGSYYFRILPNSFQPEIVKNIAEFGHEIGYHYDDLTQCKGDYSKAISRFEKNIQLLREIAEVKTICMDGSPMSSFDNKDLWKKFNYQDYGIIGEPYIDIDFDNVFYLTDTGRRWDGWKTSLRDKVPQQEEWIKKGLVFHSTNDFIKAVNEDRLPNQIMLTFHPQRWHDGGLPWLKELVVQNLKNQVKRVLVKKRMVI